MELEVAPANWDDLLVGFGGGDVYFMRGYNSSAAVIQPGRGALLHASGKRGAVVFPCLIRELPDSGVRDVVTFGYGGPLALGQSPPLEQFFALYKEWCAEQEIVTTFVRFHPLFANHRYAGPYFRRERVEGTARWLLDGDLFSGMHRHHRRVVRKAEAAGIKVTTTPAPEGLDRFVGLYHETMRRLAASPLYFFPAEYWKRLVRELGDRIVLLEAWCEGRLLASVLCFVAPPWLHYHLGATSDEGRRLGASHLLLYSAARFGQENGCTVFHLGAGLGANGGELLDYKRRFSPASGLLEQWFGKAVHDEKRYLELTGADSVVYDGFFPAFRRQAGMVS